MITPVSICTARSPAGQMSRRPFREEQVDFGGPAADPLDVDEAGDRFLVVLGKAVEIEPAGEHVLGQAARIACLLARQAGGAQRLVAGGEQALAGSGGSPTAAVSFAHIEAAAATLTCWPTIARSRVWIAARAGPRLGIAGAGERGGDARLGRGQRVERFLQSLAVDPHRPLPCNVSFA